jgi:hypothetical protein
MSFVSGGGVGHVGVCASAQYTLAAIARGARIRSFASIAGWYHDAKSVAPFYGGAEGTGIRLGRARQALETWVASGEVAMVPAYRPGDDRAGMFLEMDYYANPRRGAVPEWKNEMAEMSWLFWRTFDGVRSAAKVSVPTAMVHSARWRSSASVRAFQVLPSCRVGTAASAPRGIRIRRSSLWTSCSPSGRGRHRIHPTSFAISGCLWRGNFLAG